MLHLKNVTSGQSKEQKFKTVKYWMTVRKF